jgi:hypothetical protein
LTFLLKLHRFDLKKLTRTTQWPGQNQEPEPWIGPGRVWKLWIKLKLLENYKDKIENF